MHSWFRFVFALCLPTVIFRGRFLLGPIIDGQQKQSSFVVPFQVSGLGAGMDSFYEYLLKSYVMFEDKSDLAMFDDIYGSIKQVRPLLLSRLSRP